MERAGNAYESAGESSLTIFLKCGKCGAEISAPNQWDSVRCSCGTRVSSFRGSLLSCQYCGKKHWTTSKSRELCEAYYLFRKGTQSIKDHPEYAPREAGTNEPSPWPKIDWSSTKYIIMDRDENKCQDCGAHWPNQPNIVLEVHHIIPRTGHGTDHPANLITLCHECHLARHEVLGGYMGYPKVVAALRMGVEDEVERAQMLAGTHPMVSEARALQEATPDEREMIRDIQKGTQKTLPISGGKANP